MLGISSWSGFRPAMPAVGHRSILRRLANTGQKKKIEREIEGTLEDTFCFLALQDTDSQFERFQN